MKRVSLFLILAIIFSVPCFSWDFGEVSKVASGDGDQTKLIFKYHIPDETDEKQKTEEKVPDIVSDDVTADTTGTAEIEDNENYEISDMYNAVLQGYATYDEGDYLGINLEDIDHKALSLNIIQPYKIGIKNYTSLKTSPSLYEKLYSKYTGAEYSISSISDERSKSFGGFSAGTIYNQGIDYGELEQSSGIFSRYEYKRFALTTTYTKTINSTNNNYNDNFYIAPELKLNQYLTLKEILSHDTVKRTKKAEFIVSFNPFGKKDEDRLRFNIGASQTFDDTNKVLKNQFKFSTNYKF